MKNYIIIIIALLSSAGVFSQEEQNLRVFKPDATRGKEILKIPLGFATKIKHTGFYGVRFTEGWFSSERP